MKRPMHVKAPPYISASPPVPKPQPMEPGQAAAGEESRLVPTRYGDWERKGIAVDF